MYGYVCMYVCACMYVCMHVCIYVCIPANCSFLIRIFWFFFQEKGAIFFVRSFFCDYLLTVKHMKCMNVPFFENFTPICSILLGFKVGRYVCVCM